MISRRRNHLVLVVALSVLAAGCATTGGHRSSEVSVQYACPVCDTGFFTESEWREHVRLSHPAGELAPGVRLTEPKPVSSEIEYVCPVCDTGFITEAEWKDHVARNHPGRKAAIPAVRLKTIEKRGGGERVLYACPVCSTGFLTEEDWKEHDNLHHRK